MKLLCLAVLILSLFYLTKTTDEDDSDFSISNAIKALIPLGKSRKNVYGGNGLGSATFSKFVCVLKVIWNVLDETPCNGKSLDENLCNNLLEIHQKWKPGGYKCGVAKATFDILDKIANGVNGVCRKRFSGGGYSSGAFGGVGGYSGGGGDFSISNAIKALILSGKSGKNGYGGNGVDSAIISKLVCALKVFSNALAEIPCTGKSIGNSLCNSLLEIYQKCKPGWYKCGIAKVTLYILDKIVNGVNALCYSGGAYGGHRGAYSCGGRAGDY